MITVTVLLVVAAVLWPGAEGTHAFWRRRDPSRASGRSATGFATGTGRSDGRPPARSGLRRRRRLGSADRLDRRAQFAELVTVGLEAGLPTDAAWELAIAVHADETAAASPADGESSGGDLLDRSLRLSALSGTPAAQASRAAARALREGAAATRRRDSLLAGPRASMTVLAVLPLAGPLVAMVLGLPVMQVYAGGPALWSVLTGLGLTAAGWWVSRRIVRVAARPALVRSPASPSPSTSLSPSPRGRPQRAIEQEVLPWSS
jgi:tight adherence protein B